MQISSSVNVHVFCRINDALVIKTYNYLIIIGE